MWWMVGGFIIDSYHYLSNVAVELHWNYIEVGFLTEVQKQSVDAIARAWFMRRNGSLCLFLYGRCNESNKRLMVSTNLNSGVVRKTITACVNACTYQAVVSEFLQKEWKSQSHARHGKNNRRTKPNMWRRKHSNVSNWCLTVIWLNWIKYVRKVAENVAAMLTDLTVNH